MKINTQYETMTNDELITEFMRRMAAFADNLSTYQDGTVKIERNGASLYEATIKVGGNIVFVRDIDELWDDESPTVTITKSKKDYREILLKLLNAPFTIITNCSETREVDQQEYLEDLI